MSTSINVDHDLWKAAKMEDFKRDITLELFEVALKKEIGYKK
jgi:hypothetical protein